MPSFDVVSKVNWSEVDNAVNQAARELSQRFDFKGTQATVERVEGGLQLAANSEDRVRAALEVLREKLIRRKVSLKHLDAGEPQPGPRGSARLLVKIKEGIEADVARVLIQRIKESRLKVQVAIHDRSLRVSGKSRDELQACIRLLRSIDLPVELGFDNFRD